MMERRENGTVRKFAGITDELVREAHVHFEVICERHPGSPWVELRISNDGKITIAVWEQS
jgi:hypothetical protein